MTDRLSQTQLSQIVAEVERLATAQAEEIDREQMQVILKELNLPPELLDEAIIQVQRREALAAQKRRTQTLIIGVVAGLIVLVGGTTWWLQQTQRIYQQVGTKPDDRVALVGDEGGNLTTVTRPAEVVYHVTLTNAPVGKKLNLACNWVTLGDQIVKQNRYQTQEITAPDWNTHCKMAIGQASPPGNWKVKLFLNDRPIAEHSFEVK